MGTTSSEEIGIRKDQSVQSNLQYGIVSEGFYGKLWILPRTNQTDWNKKLEKNCQLSSVSKVSQWPYNKATLLVLLERHQHH